MAGEGCRQWAGQTGRRLRAIEGRAEGGTGARLPRFRNCIHAGYVTHMDGDASITRPVTATGATYSWLADACAISSQFRAPRPAEACVSITYVVLWTKHSLSTVVLMCLRRSRLLTVVPLRVFHAISLRYELLGIESRVKAHKRFALRGTLRASGGSTRANRRAPGGVVPAGWSVRPRPAPTFRPAVPLAMGA